MTMADRSRAELDCLRCGQQTEHELAYAGRLLVTVRCTRCGHAIERDLRRRWVGDLGSRVASKPFRMARRLRRHPVAFIASLPLSALAKPLRVLDELRLVLAAAARAQRGSPR